MLASFSLSEDGLSPSDKEDGSISSIFTTVPVVNRDRQPASLMDIILLAVQHPNNSFQLKGNPKIGLCSSLQKLKVRRDRYNSSCSLEARAQA